MARRREELEKPTPPGRTPVTPTPAPAPGPAPAPAPAPAPTPTPAPAAPNAPAYTQAQADEYYQTLSAEEKAKIDAQGGPNVAWFTAAVNAGVPDAVKVAGGQAGAPQAGWEGPGGYTLDPTGANALPPSEWLGIRPPTPSELRRYAREAGWSEDFARYSDRQLAAWISSDWDVSTNMFVGGVEKPTDTGGTQAPGQPGGAAPGAPNAPGAPAAPATPSIPDWRTGGPNVGVLPGAGGQTATMPGFTPAGAAPEFSYERFVAPSWKEAMADPGFQFALAEGQKAIEQSAAARGTLRTGGTLKDLINYSQGAALQHYGDVWDRAAADYGLNRETALSEFSPQYGAWETQYGGDLSRWTTGQMSDLARWQTGQQTELARWQTGQASDLARWQTRYGGDLSKYLQREQNIADLLNTPPPAYPGY